MIKIGGFVTLKPHLLTTCNFHAGQSKFYNLSEKVIQLCQQRYDGRSCRVSNQILKSLHVHIDRRRKQSTLCVVSFKTLPFLVKEANRDMCVYTYIQKFYFTVI